MTRKHLQVCMNGERVGTLSELKTGQLEFAYENSWLASKIARPLSLSLPLTAETYRTAAVYNFFDNLLPDNIELRQLIQQQFHTKTKNPFELLAHIGRDCVGAIQLLPENESVNIKKIRAEPLSVNAIAKLIEQHRYAPMGMRENEDFRISLAGVQTKTALLKMNNKWYKPIKATPTTHILKFPIGIIHSPSGPLDLSDSIENEWLCLNLIKAFELPVANCELKKFENHRVLCVERFDRTWSKDNSWIIRHPQEDFCQVFGMPSSMKYQADGGPGIKAIMDQLALSSRIQEDQKQFFATQFLFWLLAAPDGHAKNFSIFIKAGGGFHLTPIYDVISAYPLMKNKQLSSQKLKLAMGLIGTKNCYQWNQISSRHWQTTARACRFQFANEVIEDILRKADDAIKKLEKKIPTNFPDQVANPIIAGIKKTIREFKLVN